MWVRASTLRVRQHARKSHSLVRTAPGDSYASTHLIRCSPLARRPIATSAWTEERASERAREGRRCARWQHEEEETAVHNERARATSWCRTRNTMRAWVLASGDGQRGESGDPSSPRLCRYLSSSFLSPPISLSASSSTTSTRRTMRSAL